MPQKSYQFDGARLNLITHIFYMLIDHFCKNVSKIQCSNIIPMQTHKELLCLLYALSRIIMYLTWHRPSPAGHSRTLPPLLNVGTAAFHPSLAACHQSPRQPTPHTARSLQKGGTQHNQRHTESQTVASKMPRTMTKFDSKEKK